LVLSLRAEQRLAAILAADVAGYSRLMEADAPATVATLEACRAVFRDHVDSCGGRIVDTAGDSVLAVFASAIGAVEAALAIQDALGERNGALAEDRRMRFRIGVNLGDVIEKPDGSVYGSGVNVAARLEGLAEPGGICLSANAHEQVEGRLDAAFEDIGEHEVKNIARPVRAYKIGSDTRAEPPPTPAERPSIAVLAFENLSGDVEQEYFADGIAEDLITALSRMRWLSVTARNSTFSYKGQSPDIRDVGRELGVRYVLEGSVRKGGERVRITAQLIDAGDGSHIWAQRYDRELADIFELQDEITLTIAGAIEPELAQIERERARRKPAETLDAWDFCQRGLWHMWRYDKDDNAEAQRLFHQATDIDVDFAAAYANLAYCHFLDGVLAFNDTPRQSASLAESAAKKAIAIDERDAMAHCALGRALSLMGDHAAAIAELRAAVDLNPSFALARYGLGIPLIFEGQAAQAVQELEVARRLSPHDANMWVIETINALAHIALGQFDEAEDLSRSAIRRPNTGFWAYATLASALGNLGRISEARSALDKLLELKPDFSRKLFDSVFVNDDPASFAAYFYGLRKAGLDIPDEPDRDG
jgi:adenylate cyclase